MKNESSYKECCDYLWKINNDYSDIEIIEYSPRDIDELYRKSKIIILSSIYNGGVPVDTILKLMRILFDVNMLLKNIIIQNRKK